MNTRLTRRCFELRVSAMAGCALLSLAVLMSCGVANALTTITVNSLDDPNPGTTLCTLRDAISAANGGATVNGCTVPATDTSYAIVFASGLTGTITLSSTLPDIESNLAITGPGPASGAIAISGDKKVVVMTIDVFEHGGNTVALTDLTLEDANNGGAGFGGAIFSVGTLTVNDCTFLDNSADSDGGAILNDETLTVVNSTFSKNSANAGGAILSLGSLSVINSTFSGNNATGVAAEGGAIFNEGDGTATVINSSFASNTGEAGGALYNIGNLSLKATILAASTGGNCDNVAVSGGTLTDDGYNLSDDGSCAFETTNPSTTSKDNVANLNLGTLVNNGGPTDTIALGSGSAAIGFIPETSCTYQNVNPCTNPPAVSSSGLLVCDQRGEPRPNPGANPPACDSGAFELQTGIPFAQFKAALSVDLPDSFLLLGKFTLGAGSTFDLANQPVTLTLSSADLAPASLTIPAGSFKKTAGVYVFKGEINGVSGWAEIIPQPNKSSYTFEISASGLDLTGIGNPVTVTLQVGPNTGTAKVETAIQ